jgi:hypothetical protein
MIFVPGAERFVTGIIFTAESRKTKMRACFLGQNICNLGYGVAILQAPRLVMEEPARPHSGTDSQFGPDRQMDISGGIPERALESALGAIPEAPIGSRPVANPPRPEIQGEA